MSILQAFNIASVDDIDIDRPLVGGGLYLGPEAAKEAVHCIRNNVTFEMATLDVPTTETFYWSVLGAGGETGEIFGLPNFSTYARSLPTSVEVAMVRALHAAPPNLQAKLLQGGLQVSIGPNGICEKFHRIVERAAPPISGTSVLWGSHTQARLTRLNDPQISDTIVECLRNSFVAAPLKFRFLELYRLMEALFLEEVRLKLLRDFPMGPNAALDQATESLKAEVAQLAGMAEGHKEAFEYCWLALHDIRNSNQFSAALFRKLATSKYLSPEWKSGAALVYYIRCAIVHAGKKDMVFEAYPDRDVALEAVLPYVEQASLSLAGIETS